MDEGAGHRRVGAVEALVVAIGAVLVMLYAFRPLYAVDLFWHLRLGQIIAETWSIPSTDLFSAVHPDSPWVQFQWLWELCAHLITATFGLTGLRAVQAVVLSGTFVAFWAVLRFSRHGAGTAAGAGLASAALLVLFEDRMQVRPDPANLVLLVPALPFLLGGYRTARPAVYVAMAGLAFLWANVHSGGSVLLLAAVGALATGATLHRALGLGRAAAGEREPVGRLWALVGAMAALLVASPAFLEGMVHFQRIFGPALAIGNPEWDPSWKMLEHGLHPNFLVVATLPYACAAAYVAFIWARWRRGRAAVDLSEALMLGGFLFLAHHWVRSAYLAAVPLAVMLRHVRPGRLTRGVMIAGAVALLGVTYHYNVTRARGSLWRTLEMASFDLEPTAYPEEAAEWLVTADIEGGALNEGKWGGYLIWRNWPKIRVFVDTRHNLDDEMWRAFVATHHPYQRARALTVAAARWGLDLAIFKGPTFPLYTAPPGWALIYRAGDQEVHARTDTPGGQESIRRAATWYRVAAEELLPVRGDDGLPDLRALATVARRTGGRDWLRNRYQALRWEDAQAELDSDVPEREARGRRAMAMLLHRAGLYEDAVPSLEALPEARTDGRVMLAIALGRLQLGHEKQAREAVVRLLATDPGALSPVDRERVRLLAAALGLRAP
ncbi:MAG: hypothetical protein AMXMBFR64_02650 [Myxococcales bacterium]